MGPMGTKGIGGIVVGTTDSGVGGAFSATYNIPAALAGSYQIAIRMDSPQGFLAYNWFYNNTTGRRDTCSAHCHARRTYPHTDHASVCRYSYLQYSGRGTGCIRYDPDQ
jgi:hypothetical protein